jgi:PA domain/Secretion system C-terminal sorting domain
MQKNLLPLLLSGMFLLLGTLAIAQPDGSQNDQFFIRIASASGTRDIQRSVGQQDCGFGDSLFGPDVTKDVSGEAVWAYDSVGNDSLSCDPITNNYAGKVVLVRRGVCNFSLKAYRAQRAGAIAVLVVNHFLDPAQNGCSVFNMSGGDSATAVTIPSVFLSRDIATDLDRRIKAGEKPVVSFVLPRFYNGFGASSYGTPLSQNDTMDAVGVRYVNRTNAVQTNVAIKLDVIAPDRTVQSVTRTLASVRVNQDTFVFLPAFKPKDLKGLHRMVFSNSSYRERRDTVRREFRLTDFTYATDNFVVDPLGIGFTNDEFAESGFRVQWGSLYFTGDRAAVPTHITFGLSNVDSVFVRTDPAANDVGIFLYDADANNDGRIDLTTNFEAIERNIVASATYRMTGRELVDTLFSVRLTPRTGTRLELKRNHAYYLSYLYDGTRAGHSRCLRFTNGIEGPYLAYPTTPLFIFNELYDEYGANIVAMQRLELDGFRPTVSAEPEPPLDASKYKILPNPAVDNLRLNLELEATQSVTAQLVDLQGRIVSTEVARNFQNGQIDFDVRSLPSGVYTLWLRTDKEGSVMEQVMVCH